MHIIDIYSKSIHFRSIFSLIAKDSVFQGFLPDNHPSVQSHCSAQ